MSEVKYHEISPVLGDAVADIEELDIYQGTPPDLTQGADKLTAAGTVAAGVITATGEITAAEVRDYGGLRVSWSNGDNSEQEAEVSITHVDRLGTARTTTATVKPGTFLFLPWTLGSGGRRFLDAARVQGDGVASVSGITVAITGVQADASLTLATIQPGSRDFAAIQRIREGYIPASLCRERRIPCSDAVQPHAPACPPAKPCNCPSCSDTPGTPSVLTLLAQQSAIWGDSL